MIGINRKMLLWSLGLGLVGCSGAGPSTLTNPTSSVSPSTQFELDGAISELSEGGFEVFVFPGRHGDDLGEPVVLVRDEDVLGVNWDLQFYYLGTDVRDRVSGISERLQAVVVFEGKSLFEFTMYPAVSPEPEMVDGTTGYVYPQLGFRVVEMWLCEGSCGLLFLDFDPVEHKRRVAESFFFESIEGAWSHFASSDRLVGQPVVSGEAFRWVEDRVFVAVGCAVEADEIRLVVWEEDPWLGMRPEGREVWKLEAANGPVGLSVVELGVVPEGFLEVASFVSPDLWLNSGDHLTLEGATLLLYRDDVEVGSGYVLLGDQFGRTGWVSPFSVDELTWDDYQDWLAEYPALIGGNCSVREPDPLG